eukprot:gene5510-3927_t
MQSDKPWKRKARPAYKQNEPDIIIAAPTSRLTQSRTFKINESIEANYKGRGKYYPGRIRRDREDGTYDVDYDDGEAE